MAGRLDENLMVKLLDCIPTNNMSVRQLGYRSGIDRRTVRKYVYLIQQIQKSPQVKMETVGLRVFVRREK
jgi:hypothetical protein